MPSQNTLKLIEKRQSFLLTQMTQTIRFEKWEAEVRSGGFDIRAVEEDLRYSSEILGVPAPQDYSAVHFGNWPSLRKNIAQDWLELEKERLEIIKSFDLDTVLDVEPHDKGIAIRDKRQQLASVIESMRRVNFGRVITERGFDRKELDYEKLLTRKPNEKHHPMFLSYKAVVLDLDNKAFLHSFGGSKDSLEMDHLEREIAKQKASKGAWSIDGPQEDNISGDSTGSLRKGLEELGKKHKKELEPLMRTQNQRRDLVWFLHVVVRKYQDFLRPELLALETKAKEKPQGRREREEKFYKSIHFKEFMRELSGEGCVPKNCRKKKYARSLLAMDLTAHIRGLLVRWAMIEDHIHNVAFEGRVSVNLINKRYKRAFRPILGRDVPHEFMGESVYIEAATGHIDHPNVKHGQFNPLIFAAIKNYGSARSALYTAPHRSEDDQSQNPSTEFSIDSFNAIMRDNLELDMLRVVRPIDKKGICGIL